MVQKAHLITGKGGVGKSLVAAALAHSISLQNQHVLLSELTEHSFYEDFLELKKITYKPKPWLSNLDVCQWSPEACLKEYVLHLLKIESLYRLFFENPISKSLIQIAPGLHELALIGKITSSPRKHGPEMNYDELVVDAFSTGHFLSLLRAPLALSQIVKLGPFGEQTKSINSTIRNSNFTKIHIVTLAEELPITECIELYFEILKEFNIKSTVYLNKLIGLKNEDLETLDSEAKENFQSILEQEKKYMEMLTKNKIEFIKLPLVTSLKSKVLVEELSQELHV